MIKFYNREKELKLLEKIKTRSAAEGQMTMIVGHRRIGKTCLIKKAIEKDVDVVDQSFGYSLLVWFKSIKDHDIYQTHPVHQKFIDDHSAHWEKVVVYDSDVI